MRSQLSIAIFLSAGLCVSTGPAFSQQTPPPPPEMNARDVFWSASDLVTVSPNPATAAPNPPKPTVPRPKNTETAKKPTTTAKRQIDPKTVAANGYGVQPHLVSMTNQRLGLRYTLLERDVNGGYVETIPSTVFRSGDRVKLSVMANHPGYLYIIQQGSSGNWSPIFPGQDAAPGSNQVQAGEVYEIPKGGAFEFNQQAGKEHLYIMLSMNPIRDLDGAIFGLQEHHTPPATQPSPATAVPVPKMEASNRITDVLVQQLASRDLVPVQEEVDTSASGGDQSSEKAVYVVNSLSAESNGTRVVAKLVLDHE